jgi:anti-repressor protein
MQLQEFKFNDNQIRVIEKDGEPWFVARDVAEVLDIKNYRDTLTNYPEEEKGVATTDTLGGKQTVSIISEAGLYRMIFQSRKENAEKFKTWVFSEVLPSIRKTGSYSKPKSQAEMLLGMAQILVDMEQKIQRQDLRLEQIENKVEKKFTQEFEFQLVTPTQIGAMFEPFLSAKKTNQILRENGFQYTVQGQWVPTSKGKEFCSIDYVQLDNGKMIPQLLWQRRIKEQLIFF